MFTQKTGSVRMEKREILMIDINNAIRGINKILNETNLYNEILLDVLSLLNKQKEKIESLEQTIEDICCG